MLRPTIIVGFLLTTMMASGCATTQEKAYDPFKVSREEFCSKTKTIAMIPITLPHDLENPGPVKEKFESLIEKALRQAGYRVIPAKETDEIWKHIREESGGFFDPVTGKKDETKYELVKDRTRREACTRFNADAFLYSAIGVYKVRWSGWAVNWHGTSEDLKTTGRKVLEAFGGVVSYGTVPALSLIVSMEDANGAAAYANVGGIQLLSKLEVANKFVPVPREQLFNDEERNVKAVEIALGPFLHWKAEAGGKAMEETRKNGE